MAVSYPRSCAQALPSEASTFHEESAAKWPGGNFHELLSAEFTLKIGLLLARALSPPRCRMDSCLEIVVAAPSAIKAEPVVVGGTDLH